MEQLFLPSWLTTSSSRGERNDTIAPPKNQPQNSHQEVCDAAMTAGFRLDTPRMGDILRKQSKAWDFPAAWCARLLNFFVGQIYLASSNKSFFEGGYRGITREYTPAAIAAAVHASSMYT